MNDFTPNQVKCAISLIASKAAAAQELCQQAIGNPEESVELVLGACAIIEQIGWIADHHVEPLDRYKGDAVQWFMPPIYHDKE